MKVTSLVKYKDNYSPNRFWSKLKRSAGKIGKETVFYILVLYYVMMDKKTPLKYKAIIAGALGYLILPLDVVPDAIPFIGFSDDAAAIVAAYKAIVNCITPEIETKARNKLNTLFP